MENAAFALLVRDDGIGFPPTAGRESHGIVGMREFALLVGARRTLRRLDPHGTEVSLRLPPDEIRDGRGDRDR